MMDGVFLELKLQTQCKEIIFVLKNVRLVVQDLGMVLEIFLHSPCIDISLVLKTNILEV